MFSERSYGRIMPFPEESSKKISEESQNKSQEMFIREFSEKLLNSLNKFLGESSEKIHESPMKNSRYSS